MRQTETHTRTHVTHTYILKCKHKRKHAINIIGKSCNYKTGEYNCIHVININWTFFFHFIRIYALGHAATLRTKYSMRYCWHLWRQLLLLIYIHIVRRVWLGCATAVIGLKCFFFILNVLYSARIQYTNLLSRHILNGFYWREINYHRFWKKKRNQIYKLCVKI